MSTVIGTAVPSSSKIWVIPTLRPSSPTCIEKLRVAIRRIAVTATAPANPGASNHSRGRLEPGRGVEVAGAAASRGGQPPVAYQPGRQPPEGDALILMSTPAGRLSLLRASIVLFVG